MVLNLDSACNGSRIEAVNPSRGQMCDRARGLLKFNPEIANQTTVVTTYSEPRFDCGGWKQAVHLLMMINRQSG